MDQQLSGIDASFLYLETPETPMHVAGLTYFQLPEGFQGSFYQHFRRFFEGRLHTIPIFSKRLAPSLYDLDHPVHPQGHVGWNEYDLPSLPDRLEGDWRLVGAYERLRFYRYSPGQRFAPHFDGSFQRSPTERSLVTFLVYLNSCEKRGETRLTDLELDVVPAAGRALLFNHFLLHEGALVAKGLKYVVRSDLMYRRE